MSSHEECHVEPAIDEKGVVVLRTESGQPARLGKKLTRLATGMSVLDADLTPEGAGLLERGEERSFAEGPVGNQ